ncbi:BCCT family transporter [Parendozoicomonas haliclonae]|uniref:High-affinity choline transport protein n=1 Tax=Parendozoicomonas haliclonae TaxID=1960125 RepID=A0A1X7AQN0_9GAMM|nr:BCCT family transporter [Parendozoicomonas haliclonae]SMA50606.1 High-affinity choline transport protein [Parendozoicomonas haliclonae]
MTAWLSAGLIFTFLMVLFFIARWGGVRAVGQTPVKTLTFLAILFTSGLDVGLIMFPLTEFGGYADTAANPEYAFTNPLAIEFGFWGFLIWAFYFLTCFYFCIIEPKVKFFEIPLVKRINNAIIIGTCAFTAYLLLINLPWYLPQLGDGKTIVPAFYGIVFMAIAFAVYSSTSLRYVRFLSLATSLLFLGLIGFMWYGAVTSEQGSVAEWASSLTLLGGYFANIEKFALPMNDYHEFYLFWWFSWSIMIGQFTARFVGGLSARQLFAAMLVVPSIPLALWFSVLYYYHTHSLDTSGIYNLAMVIVGVTFVINSLDSLIRLYTDNLNMTVARLGKSKYIWGNIALMSVLTLLFQLNFLQIQWVGAIVIGLFFSCFGYILLRKLKPVMAIEPEEDVKVDYRKIETA